MIIDDQLQLTPVCGTPLYRLPTPDTTSTPGNATQRGHSTYREFENVVYLQENMRFKNDPEWGTQLSDARRGIWTPDIKRSIKERFLQNIPLPNLIDTFDGHLTRIVTVDNNARHAYNNASISTLLNKRNLTNNFPIYKIPAILSSRSVTDIRPLLNLPDNNTGNSPAILHAYVGMPVRIKMNQQFEKGSANGAFATIHHIDWPSSTTFTQDLQGYTVPLTPPLNIYVDINEAPPTPPFPGLPITWPSTVLPVAKSKTSFTYGPAKLSVSIHQWPLVPAFASTCHGIQGFTTDRICVDNPRPPTCKKVDRHSLYVSLSRVRTRKGLIMLTELTEKDYNFFIPTNEVLREDDRLQQLAKQTLKQYTSYLSLPSPLDPVF